MLSASVFSIEKQFEMSVQAMPRYLRVAQWLYEHQGFMSARELAPLFNVAAKRITDDFARIRKHHHIFKIEEQKVAIQGGYKYRVRVLQIAPYRMDGRKFPVLLNRVLKPVEAPPSPIITWADLQIGRASCRERV